MKNKRKFGFTLAEVLITLGVIGVVAAMTMPVLIQKHQEKVTVVKLKKAYSVLSNAYLMAKTEDENVKNWYDSYTTTRENSEAFYKHLKPYLKVTKDCGFEKGCLTEGPVKTLGGVDYRDYNSNKNEYRVILADGTSVMFYVPIEDYSSSSGASYRGNIKVDINGFKGPYTFGKDFFVFDITESKIVPSGVIEQELGRYKCDRKSTDRNSTGSDCTAWVIYNENMDYLHCDDLSWNGKHKCD